MRILIAGDSLVFYPIKFYKKSYSFLLKKYFSEQGHEVFIIAKADNNSKIQVKSNRMYYDIIQFKPNIVLLQLGINDCAPRLFTELDEFFLNNLPVWFKMKIIHYFSRKRYYFTKKYTKIHVDQDKFRQNFYKIIKVIKENGAIPILINIAKPSRLHLKRSYRYINQVLKYNKVLNDISRDLQCKLINLYKIIESNPSLLFNDGIHLSKAGHLEFSRILIKEIKKYL